MTNTINHAAACSNVQVWASPIKKISNAKRFASESLSQPVPAVVLDDLKPLYTTQDMISKKRGLEEASSSQKSKKPKKQDEPSREPAPKASLLSAEEVDFPRGGGTSLTALEVKAARAEAVREADAELFEEKDGKSKAGKKKKASAAAAGGEKKSDKIRIEHLNYKVSTHVHARISGRG
jgi:hypothetical protein